MKEYFDLVSRLMTSDVSGFKLDRTGTGTISYFGTEARFKLSDGFPLMTTKKLHLKSIIHELIWFVSGNTNTKYLTDNGVRIWNEWANENGDLGPIYGYQWRHWPDPLHNREIDQLQGVINSIKKSPDSRRHIVSAWNVAQLDYMALPPCHMLYQFNVQERNGETQLDLKLTQRSADIFIGVPFNIPSYAALNMLVANETGLKPGYLIMSFGDLHCYLGGTDRLNLYKKNHYKIKGWFNEVKKREDYLVIKSDLEKMVAKAHIKIDNAADHLPQLILQMSREPYPLPKLSINPSAGINNLKFDDFELSGYQAHPHIKGDVAV
jgi:thymidylate synthase